MLIRIFILLFLTSGFAVAQRKRVCLNFVEIHEACSDTVNYRNKKYSDVKPKKLSRQKIFLYSKKKCIDTVFTNEEGVLCLNLKKGFYELYLPYKHYKKHPFASDQGFDEQCLTSLWKKPDATIKKKFSGYVFVNRRIGYHECPTKHPCLKPLHTKDTAPSEH